MANDLSILKGAGSALASLDAYKNAVAQTQAAAGASEYKRISIRGKAFRVMHGKEEVKVFKSEPMNIVIVGASKVVRTFYDKDYDPKADAPVFPSCWSNDGMRPDDRVPEDQKCASSCRECPNDVKGSARQGKGKACRSSMNLAVCIDGRWDDVYLMSIPAMSLFGKKQDQNYPLQAYLRVLAANKAPMQAVVTEVSFDEDADVPKLFFKPVEMLDEARFLDIMEKANDPENEKLLDLDFSNTGLDGGDDVALPALTTRKRRAEPAEEEVAEPKKRPSTKKPTPSADETLEDEVDEW